MILFWPELQTLRIKMPLLEFYKNNKDIVLSQTIIQIVNNAGDGNLRDSTVCSSELREFLSLVQHEYLKNIQTLVWKVRLALAVNL